jgi:hypothetical protein
MEAIKAMKKGKAAEIDNIPAEILQVDPHLAQKCCIHFSWIYGRKKDFLRTGKRVLL